MVLSALDLYSVGIGPSSSHTVGPMRAAKMFVDSLQEDGVLTVVANVTVDLYGSLGSTGLGHASDKAIVLGLEGEDPARTDPGSIDARMSRVVVDRKVVLAGSHSICFDLDSDLTFHRNRSLPRHPNGMVFTALDGRADTVRSATYYSVGGGFVLGERGMDADRIAADGMQVQYPFSTAAGLLRICEERGLRVSDVMSANEQAWRDEADLHRSLLDIWRVMSECVRAGCSTEGVLPGGLKVPRRAPRLYQDLRLRTSRQDPLDVMDWVNLYALAVNEENAAGGRIVTAPTNGAAGIIPAVLHYYWNFVRGASEEGIIRFLLTAAAIGVVIKENASISGAEVGCQGEVGSACAMAAAGLCEVLGGTPEQVENAAEIGIEHHLGLTCDPVGGLVQIPCIERNAIAAVKAINAARLSLHGTGLHIVSLDSAIATMRDTGRDMHVKYKETSQGGLAVNVVEC